MKLIILSFCILLSSTALLADEEIEARLRNMDCIVPVKIDASVTKRINMMLKSRKDTEKLIGRSATYFPIFDQYLKEYDLPTDLRYITCLETELNNTTVSNAGAKGIWQLMPDVKEEFGLRIDGVLDERYDLNRATEAALKDLKRMYKALGSWELTLAGYNCGIGALTRAMKRAKSKDFDRVKEFLPEQTQQYISKFIAFTYMMKNYRNHGLKPAMPNLDIQIINSIKVYNYLSLATVANITGIAYETIRDLNKQFGDGYVPDTKDGCNVYVPRRVQGALEDYVSQPDLQKESNINFSPMVVDESLPKLENEPNYFKTTYYLGENETLDEAAQLFNIGVYNILLWNKWDSLNTPKEKELTLYLPRIVPKRA